VVEMHLEHPLLYDNVQVVVPPTGNQENFSQILKTLFETTTPIIIYGIADDILSNQVCLCYDRFYGYWPLQKMNLDLSTAFSFIVSITFQ